MDFIKNGMDNLMGLGFGAAVPGLRDSVKNMVGNLTSSEDDQKAKIQSVIDATLAEQQSKMNSQNRPQSRMMAQAAPEDDGGYKSFKKGGKISTAVHKKALENAGFYEKGNSTEERKKIISKVTTKPQRLGMVEKIFSSKKMKKGGTVSSASKRADGCAVKGKTKGRII